MITTPITTTKQNFQGTNPAVASTAPDTDKTRKVVEKALTKAPAPATPPLGNCELRMVFDELLAHNWGESKEGTEIRNFCHFGQTGKHGHVTLSPKALHAIHKHLPDTFEKLLGILGGQSHVEFADLARTMTYRGKATYVLRPCSYDHFPQTTKDLFRNEAHYVSAIWGAVEHKKAFDAYIVDRAKWDNDGQPNGDSLNPNSNLYQSLAKLVDCLSFKEQQNLREGITAPRLGSAPTSGLYNYN